MVVNKRKKNSRQRGSHTHGYGSKKKHRGAGSRGGRGRAGSGKRGDAKKPSTWGTNYFGIRGIKARKREDKIINTQSVKSKLNKWLQDKKIEKKQDTFIIDLKKLGYDKLLCKNMIDVKLDITVDKCSPKAKEKIEKAGGKVNLTEVKKKENKPKEIKEKIEKNKPIQEKTKDKTITKTELIPNLKVGVFNHSVFGIKNVALKCGVLNP